MSLRPLRVLIAIVAVAAMTPSIAQAQIYSWRDAAGNLVLSDRAKDSAAQVKTYAVVPAPTSTTSFKTTKGAVTLRAAKYDSLIEESAKFHGVDANLVRAVIQEESGFNERARSSVGAMGLMQLMPATAAELGVDDPYNPIQNVRAGVAYLKGLLVKFAQNVQLALAAYNAGPTAVARYGAVPPYKETRDYVTRITTAVGKATPAPKVTRIFRTVEIVNGREVIKYSTRETRDAQLVATTTTPTRPSVVAALRK
jgi:soluble lytic murein transglycosylase-like protein